MHTNQETWRGQRLRFNVSRRSLVTLWIIVSLTASHRGIKKGGGERRRRVGGGVGGGGGGGGGGEGERTEGWKRRPRRSEDGGEGFESDTQDKTVSTVASVVPDTDRKQGFQDLWRQEQPRSIYPDIQAQRREDIMQYELDEVKILGVFRVSLV